MYHSNIFLSIINHTHYKLKQHLEKIDKKHKEHRTENNEAKSSVLVEQDRRSIRQKSNGNRRT